MSASPETITITGCGAVCSAGDERALWVALDAGTPAFRPWAGDGTGLPGVVGAQLGWDRKELRSLPGGKGLRPGTMTWHTVLASGAVGRALADAGIHQPEADPDEIADRRAVILGSMTNFPELDKHVRLTHTMSNEAAAAQGRYEIDDARVMAGMKGFTGFDFLKLMNNMPTAHAVLMANARGPANTYLGGASSLVAVARAADQIGAGLADQVVAGGTGPGAHEGFVLARHARREVAELTEVPNVFPASTRAVPGDGAAVFVLEREATASARGARVRARIVVADDRFAEPAVDHGCATAEQIAHFAHLLLERAGWDPKSVDLVGLSGSGDERIDGPERAAAALVFGPAADGPARVLPGSVIGWCESAQGALSLAAVLQAFEAGRAPGGVPLVGPWAEAEPRVGSRSHAPRRALVLSAAPGGTLAGLCVEAG